MFLTILVGVDGSPSSRRALAHAAAVARAFNSLLTLICVEPPVASAVTLAGVSMERMGEELEQWAARILSEAQSELPEGVIAHTLQRRGHPGEEIVAELERGRYDLVVLGSRGRGKLQEGFFGSVNGHVHFHARVPILSVPDEEADQLDA